MLLVSLICLLDFLLFISCPHIKTSKAQYNILFRSLMLVKGSSTNYLMQSDILTLSPPLFQNNIVPFALAYLIPHPLPNSSITKFMYCPKAYSLFKLYFSLSRARRVVENAFGIMSSRFRVLRTPLLLDHKNAVSVVKAVVTLHNYIIQNCNSDKNYLDQTLLQGDYDGSLTPASWEQQGATNLTPLRQLAGNRNGREDAKIQREKMARIMIADGLAPWQFKMAFRTS